MQRDTVAPNFGAIIASINISYVKVDGSCFTCSSEVSSSHQIQALNNN